MSGLRLRSSCEVKEVALRGAALGRSAVLVERLGDVLAGVARLFCQVTDIAVRSRGSSAARDHQGLVFARILRSQVAPISHSGLEYPILQFAH